MDFFARQDNARRNTKLLELYFLLAVVSTVLLIYFALAILLSKWDIHRSLWDVKLFGGVLIGTLAVIVGGSLFKMAQLAGGGKSVAELMGGRPVDSNTADPDERKFLNVVEEMSIASGTPVPQLYILPGETGINAFAAGHSTNDMVICATHGAIKFLKRDELQGVIGHEFSHILNGDMKLNLRLMGLVFGLLCLAILGRILLNTSGDEKKNPLPIIGIVLLVVGGIGVFFAKLIKSAVSRQREFLADASSVQFTRNPTGLANALKKVGSSGSRIASPHAEDASHFFFANGLNESFMEMFSTHPPLEQRIRALDPAWDGQFIQLDFDALDQSPQEEEAPPTPANPMQFGNLLGGRMASAGIGPATLITASILSQTGAPTLRHLDYAKDWQSKLPPEIEAAAREPMSAVALIYALLLSSDGALLAKQLAQLQPDAGIYSETNRLFPLVRNLEGTVRLPLVSLSMTALRRLSYSQYEQFVKNMQFIIESDNQIELFEYALQKIVLRQLEPNFKPPQRVAVQYYVLKPVLPDCVVLLSALAYVGQSEPAAIQNAFQQGINALKLTGTPILSETDCSLAKVDAALEHLNLVAPQIKKIILNACAETVAADGVIEESEAELLRAIADTLDCPIPPLLSL